MSENKRGFKTVPFTRARQLVIDAGRMGRRNHNIHALLELDITEARQRLREYKERTGESFSLSAFLIACIGQAVEADRMVHAYRNWRDQLVIYESVNVLITVEIDLGDRKFPMIHMIRDANHRSPKSIHDEIRAIKTNPSPGKNTSFMRVFSLAAGVPAGSHLPRCDA